jgi:TP901 family phage tail tape measure protein
MVQENLQLRVGAVGLAESIRREAARAEAQLASKPIKMNLDTKGFRQPLGRITHDVSEFNKSMDASVARVLAFGAAMGVINSVSNALKAMASNAIKVEKALKDVNVILNLNNSQLATFGDQLFDVARKTSQSFDTVSEAAVEFARQGLGAEETLKRINDAMVLSRLSGLKAAESVSSLTAAVNSYAKVGISTTQVINRLANVDAAFAVSSADLANAIQRAGASAQGAKVEFNELLAVVTSVQQQTARGGAVIGNAFKSIFTRLQRSGVRDTLEELGVATENTNGSLRSGIDVLRDYAKIYGNLTDQQKAYTDSQIAGLFQINNLKALLSDLTSEYSIYDKALRTADSSTNQAIQRNEELNKTLSSLLLRTGASIEELAAKLGEIGASEGITRLVNMVKSAADLFNNLLGDGEGEGSDFAKNLVRGIGSFLTGPGLVIIGAALAKIFGQVTKFGVSAFKEILGLNVETKRQEALQKAIGVTLAKNEQLYGQIMGLAGNTAAQEQLLLNYIKQETKERLAQEQIMKRIASSTAFTGIGAGPQGFVPAGKRGARKAGRATLGMSSGFVPNFRKNPAQSAEYMGMLAGGYSKKALRNPKIKKTKIHDGKGKSFFAQTNGHENIKTFTNLSGKKATMVVPEKQSTAYKNFTKTLKGKIASGGFVPNFAKALPSGFMAPGQGGTVPGGGKDTVSKKIIDATKLVTMLVPDASGTHVSQGGVTMPEGHIQRVRFMQVGPMRRKEGTRGTTKQNLDKISKNKIIEGSRNFARFLDTDIPKGQIVPPNRSEWATTAGRIFEAGLRAVLKSPSFGSETATFDFLGGDRSKGGVFDWNTPLADAKTSSSSKNRASMAAKTIQFLGGGQKAFDKEYKKEDPKAIGKIKKGVKNALGDVRLIDETQTRSMLENNAVKKEFLGKRGRGTSRFNWKADGYIPSFSEIFGGMSNMYIDHMGSGSGIQSFSSPMARMVSETGSKQGKNLWRALEALGVSSVSKKYSLNSFGQEGFNKFLKSDSTAKRLSKALNVKPDKLGGHKGDFYELYRAKDRFGPDWKSGLTNADLPFDMKNPSGATGIGEAKAFDVLKGKSAAGQQANILTKSLFSDSDRGLFKGISEKLIISPADSAMMKIPDALASEMKAAGYNANGGQVSRADLKKFAKASMLGWRKTYNERKFQRTILSNSTMFKGKQKIPATVPFSGRNFRGRLSTRRGLRNMGASAGYVPSFSPLTWGKIKGTGGTGRQLTMNETLSSFRYTKEKNKVAEIDFVSSMRKGDASKLFDEVMKKEGAIKSGTITPQRVWKLGSKTNFEDLMHSFPQLQYRLKSGMETTGRFVLPDGSTFRFQSLKDLKQRVNSDYKREEFRRFIEGQGPVGLGRMGVQDLTTTLSKQRKGDAFYRNYANGYLGKGVREAIKREQAVSGQKAVVERSKFLGGGIGVYNKGQQRKYGSLDRTIQRDHLGQGQLRSTLGKTGSGKEKYVSGGFAPNFAGYKKKGKKFSPSFARPARKFKRFKKDKFLKDIGKRQESNKRMNEQAYVWAADKSQKAQKLQERFHLDKIDDIFQGFFAGGYMPDDFYPNFARKKKPVDKLNLSELKKELRRIQRERPNDLQAQQRIQDKIDVKQGNVQKNIKEREDAKKKRAQKNQKFDTRYGRVKNVGSPSAPVDPDVKAERKENSLQKRSRRQLRRQRRRIMLKLARATKTVKGTVGTVAKMGAYGVKTTADALLFKGPGMLTGKAREKASALKGRMNAAVTRGVEGVKEHSRRRAEEKRAKKEAKEAKRQQQRLEKQIQKQARIEAARQRKAEKAAEKQSKAVEREKRKAEKRQARAQRRAAFVKKMTKPFKEWKAQAIENKKVKADRAAARKAQKIEQRRIETEEKRALERAKLEKKERKRRDRIAGKTRRQEKRAQAKAQRLEEKLEKERIKAEEKAAKKEAADRKKAEKAREKAEKRAANLTKRQRNKELKRIRSEQRARKFKETKERFNAGLRRGAGATGSAIGGAASAAGRAGVAAGRAGMGVVSAGAQRSAQLAATGLGILNKTVANVKQKAKQLKEERRIKKIEAKIRAEKQAQLNAAKAETKAAETKSQKVQESNKKIDKQEKQEVKREAKKTPKAERVKFRSTALGAAVTKMAKGIISPIVSAPERAPTGRGAFGRDTKGGKILKRGSMFGPAQQGQDRVAGKKPKEKLPAKTPEEVGRQRKPSGTDKKGRGGLVDKVDRSASMMGWAFGLQMAASMAQPYVSDFREKQIEGTSDAGMAGAAEGAVNSLQYAPFLLMIPKFGLALAALTVTASTLMGALDGLVESASEASERFKKEAGERQKRDQRESENRQGLGQAVAELRSRERGTDVESIRTARDAVRKRLSGVTDSEQRRILEKMIKQGASTRDIATELERQELSGSDVRGADNALSFINKDSYDNKYGLESMEERDRIFEDSANSFASIIGKLDSDKLKVFQDSLGEAGKGGEILTKTFEKMRDAQIGGNKSQADLMRQQFENYTLSADDIAKARKSLDSLGILSTDQGRQVVEEAETGGSQEALKKVLVALQAGNQRVISGDFEKSAEAVAGLNRSFEQFSSQLKFSEQIFKQYNSMLNKAVNHQNSMYQKIGTAAIDLGLKYGKGANSISESVKMFNIDFAQRSGSIGEYEAIEKSFAARRESMNRNFNLDSMSNEALYDVSVDAITAGAEARRDSLFREYNQASRRTAVDQIFGSENKNTELQAVLKRSIKDGEVDPSNVTNAIGRLTSQRSSIDYASSFNDRKVAQKNLAEARQQRKDLIQNRKDQETELALQQSMFGRRPQGPGTKYFRTRGDLSDYPDETPRPLIYSQQSDPILEKAIERGDIVSDRDSVTIDGQTYDSRAIQGIYNEADRIARSGTAINIRDFIRGPMDSVGPTVENNLPPNFFRTGEGSGRGFFGPMRGSFVPQPIEDATADGRGGEVRPASLSDRNKEYGTAKISRLGDVQPSSDFTDKNVIRDFLGALRVVEAEEVNAPAREAQARIPGIQEQIESTNDLIEVTQDSIRQQQADMPDEGGVKISNIDQFANAVEARASTLAGLTADGGPEDLAVALENGQVTTAAQLKSINEDLNRSVQSSDLERRKQTAQLEIQRQISEEQLRVEEEQTKKLAALDKLNFLAKGISSTQEIREVQAQAEIITASGGGRNPQQGRVLAADARRKIASKVGMPELFTQEDRIELAQFNVQNMAGALRRGGQVGMSNDLLDDWEQTKQLILDGDIESPFTSETEKLDKTIKELIKTLRGNFLASLEQEVTLAVPDEMMNAMERVEYELQNVANEAFNFKNDLINISSILANVGRARVESEGMKPLVEVASEYRKSMEKSDQEIKTLEEKKEKETDPIKKAEIQQDIDKLLISRNAEREKFQERASGVSSQFLNKYGNPDPLSIVDSTQITPDPIPVGDSDAARRMVSGFPGMDGKVMSAEAQEKLRAAMTDVSRTQPRGSYDENQFQFLNTLNNAAREGLNSQQTMAKISRLRFTQFGQTERAAPQSFDLLGRNRRATGFNSGLGYTSPGSSLLDLGSRKSLFDNSALAPSPLIDNLKLPDGLQVVNGKVASTKTPSAPAPLNSMPLTLWNADATSTPSDPIQQSVNKVVPPASSFPASPRQDFLGSDSGFPAPPSNDVEVGLRQKYLGLSDSELQELDSTRNPANNSRLHDSLFPNRPVSVEPALPPAVPNPFEPGGIYQPKPVSPPANAAPTDDNSTADLSQALQQSAETTRLLTEALQNKKSEVDHEFNGEVQVNFPNLLAESQKIDQALQVLARGLKSELLLAVEEKIKENNQNLGFS